MYDVINASDRLPDIFLAETVSEDRSSGMRITGSILRRSGQAVLDMPICEASGHEIWPASLPVSAADLTYPTARRLSVRCGCLDAVGLACEQRRMRADNPAHKADTLQRYGPY
jgi:hypothetical protein